MLCYCCGKVHDSNKCRMVVIDSDTDCTLLAKRNGQTDDQFLDRYYALVDSGLYPNMTRPMIECDSCRIQRLEKVDAELEYWRRKNGTYD